ncbi:hypothetical protein CARUB_v10018333mg [Capsella rubella]|uniref:Uncharacterized protein n=1 Tax=Capsella rubella TaxID=81985 RepID=R0FRX8_9BRAS|nr:hypothetical protein CARUB_v10018333mg [Capsella rubella]
MANKVLFHLLVIFLSLSHFFFLPSPASRPWSSMEKPTHIDLPQHDVVLVPTIAICRVSEVVSIADR